MKTLSEQLTDVYEPLVPQVIEQLKLARKETQCPFVLSVARHPSDPNTYIQDYESWYAHADVKVMFFGQEVHLWEKNEDEDFRDVQRKYEELYEDMYIITDQGGYWDERKIASGNRFLRWGCNGIMSGIVEQILRPNYPGKRVSMIWNNISKLSTKTGGPVDPAITHTIEHNYFNVIPAEVEILQPDIVIFLTGPGFNNKYYDYIKENFTFTGEPTSIGNIPIDQLARLPLKEAKLAYKTYHPNFRVPKGMKAKELNGMFYKAIIEDIKLHISEIIK